MVTKRTDSLTPQHGGVLTIKVEATAKLPLNRGPGERVRTDGPPFTRSTALCTVRASCNDGTRHRTDGLAALELSDAAFHESFHANGPATVHGRIRP
jgi:hypothetical protein